MAGSGYLSSVAGNLYAMIKAGMPWVVVGMLLTLATSKTAIRVWAITIVPASLLIGWIVMPGFGWQDVKDIVFVLPGLALGLRLGESMRQAGDKDAKSAVQAEPRPKTAISPVIQAATQKTQQLDQTDNAHSTWAGRTLAVMLGAGVLYGLINFPVWRFELLAGFLIYVGLLVRWPAAWLIVVPAALPLLDLAHWSGRFFWDEFDFLMTLTLAVALWQGRLRGAAWHVPKMTVLLILFVLAATLSLLIGLLPWQPLDANAFSAYWSHYNSLRVGKGLLWGLVFFWIYRAMPQRAEAFDQLSLGMMLGVFGVSLWTLWEQMLFAGGANTADYRVTAGFSSMHTGGGHIEAYLVIALPFVWGLVIQSGNWLRRLFSGVVLLLGMAAISFTVARGGVVALAGVTLILLFGTWRAYRKNRQWRRGLALPAIIGVLMFSIIGAGLSGEFWKQRLAQTGTDAGIRYEHWSELLALRDPGWITRILGQGLGTLPAANLASQLPEKAGSYRYVEEPGNTWLALNSAGNLYMAQRVDVRPDEALRLEVSVRAPDSPAGLETSLCEKNLFNSRQCQWLKLDVASGAQTWQPLSQAFNSGNVGAGGWLTRRPVQFSLYNPQAGTVVHVDKVRLLDAQGRNLLRNGDFEQGGDDWLFKSGDHLFWHAKNLWVHLLFEQGWLGALLLTALVALAFVRLMRSAASGGMHAVVLLAVLVGWTIVGVVDSLVDAPRLAQLVYGLLFISAGWGASRQRATRRPVCDRAEGPASETSADRAR